MAKKTTKAKAMWKEQCYAEKGIEYVCEDGKDYIIAPIFGRIKPLLVNGNEKIGEGVYHFSTLPTTAEFTAVIDGREYTENGTCPCSCKGCYATKGNYRYNTTKASLLIKTRLVRVEIDFVKRAILAQIEADHISFIRIHASGDFFSAEYVEMWKEIIKASPSCTFWTYTKYSEAVTAFDSFSNANIVKSVIPHHGFNFGHIDYIIAVYEELKKQGKSVYICRCGIDKNQHCNNCKSCSTHEFVLFIEHSTEYKAEKDPLFETVKAIIEAQEEQ